MQAKHQIKRDTYHKFHSGHKECSNTSLFPERHFLGNIVVQSANYKKTYAANNSHRPMRVPAPQDLDAIIKAPSNQKEDAAFD